MTEQVTEPLPADEATQVPAGPVRVPWATVPKVNLLPLEIVQGRRFRRTKQWLGVLVLAGILVAAAGVYLAQREVSHAREDLSAAQSQVTTRQAEAAKYSAVPAVIAQVDKATAARTDVMGQDVLWYQFLSDLQGALPAGVTQKSVTVTLTPAAQKSGAAAAPAASPLTTGGVGTLTITGDAQQYQEISAWLDALGKVNGVSSASLTNATKSQGATGISITYSITAVVTDDAFSHRYDTEGS